MCSRRCQVGDRSEHQEVCHASIRLLLAIVAIALLGLIGIDPTAATRAQDATPLAGGLGLEIAPGVTAGLIPTREDAPPLFRIRFAPGVSYEEEPAPVVRLIYGEVGTLHLRLDLPVTVVRAGATDAPGESIAADTEFTLNAGDYTVYPPNVRKIMRNDGQEPAQVAVAQLDPGQLAASLMATPVP
jgi:hypothetical protein